MPLPYAQKRQVAGLIIQKRQADSLGPMENAEESPDQGLTACAQEMIDAMHAKDPAALAAALRNAMEVLESEEPQEASEVDATDGA